MISWNWVLSLLYTEAFIVFSCGAVEALNLRQWTGDRCTGISNQCSNIGQGRCCGSVPSLSVSCNTNCGTNVRHFSTFDNSCDSFQAGRRGGEHNCLWSPLFRTEGHFWIDYGFPRSRGAESSPNTGAKVFEFADICELEERGEPSGKCKGPVFPDLWMIEGRFFQVNGSTPQSVNDTLKAIFAAEVAQQAGSSANLDELAPYEIDKPEDWDDEDAE